MYSSYLWIGCNLVIVQFLYLIVELENQHSLQEFHISERMAENVKEEMIIVEIEIKEKFSLRKKFVFVFVLHAKRKIEDESEAP